MKAWNVRKKNEFGATVVFAETRGKAKVMAQSTEACEDVDFCDIEVRRAPTIDKYYKDGKKEMDWFNKEDRIALVKEAGFHCEYIEPECCEYCPAKEYCDMYQDYKEEEEAEKENTT